MSKLDKEVKAVKAFFDGSKTFEKVRYDEDERNLYFTFNAGKRKLRFQFYVPYGYPDDPSPDERPLLMQEEGLHDDLVEQVNDLSREGGSLLQAIELVHKLLLKKFNLKVSRDVSQMSRGGKAKEDPMESEEEEHSASESEEEFYDEDDDIQTGNPRLRKDVEEAEAYFGKGSLKYFPELALVRLFVDTSFLTESVAAALGIDCHIPVNVSLHFGEDYLLSPQPPKFEIDQKPKAEQFGLQFQITEIVRNWIRNNWGKNEYATSLTTSSGGMSGSSSSSSSSSSTGGMLGKFFNKKQRTPDTSSSSSSPSSPSSSQEAKTDVVYEPDKKWPKQLKELMDMGFERDVSMYALQTTHGVVSEALNMCLDPQPWFVEEAKKMAKSQGQPATRALSKSQASRTKYNFLISLVIYLRSRIANCSNYCPICDVRHECEGLKPIVCSKPDCVWRYEELGLGANVNAEIARAPEVVDLMISLACAAVNSGRADVILEPYPVADFSNNGTKDVNRLKTVLEGLPSMAELTGAPEIRPYLDLIDPSPPTEKNYYRLVRWLLTSNRAHLVRLSEEQQIKEMATPYQYMLLTSTPEKEARFVQLKKKYGSFLAFHGSPMENWHSILRNGLRNMSNTKNMLHGAAHGAGIYLAPNAGTSQGYMRAGTGWAKSQFGSSLSCLAMCEVINHPDLYGRDHNQWCYVAKEDDHVMTRFFFIYSSTSTFPAAINARQLTVPDIQSFKSS